MGFLGVGCSTTDRDVRSLDRNGDAEVTRDELAARIHENSVRVMDTDFDDIISRQEWIAAHQSAEDADLHFNRIDKDGDGQIELDESVLFVKEHVRYGNVFKELDLDNDDVLQFSELSTLEPEELEITLFKFRY